MTCKATSYAEFNVGEETSHLLRVTPTLFNDNGNEVSGSLLPQLVDSITLTIIETASGNVVNSRSNQDVLNTNGGLLDAETGVFTFEVTPDDTAIVNEETEDGTLDLHSAVLNGTIEEHLMTFTATWSTDRKDNWEVLLKVLSERSVPQGA